MISLSQWPAVERLLLAALEHPASERSAYVDSRCPDNLRPIVFRLLDKLERGEMSDGLVLDLEWLQAAAAHSDNGEEDDRTGNGLSDRMTQIGPYRLSRLLGAGGMGEVYLANRDSKAFPSAVALKVMREDLVGDDTILRFRRERIMLAAAEGACVPRLLDAGTTPSGRPYYVMEYVEGLPITEYCTRRGLDAAERLQLFENVCRAVARVHERLIVHRDLKPGHIFVTEVDGAPVIKLLDFGIATVALPPDPHGGSPASRRDSPTFMMSMLDLTQDGTAPFTSRYAAPEQRITGAVGTAADIYALGVVLCDLLASPGEGHIGESEREAVAARIDPSLSAFREVCKRALEPAPGDRFASAEAFAGAVRALRLEGTARG